MICALPSSAVRVDGSASTDMGMTVASAFLLAAGFGIALAVSSLVLGTWFKNARAEVMPGLLASSERAGKAVRLFFIFLFILAIIFGPIIGIANAVEVYTNLLPGSPVPNDSAQAISRQLSQASSTVNGGER